MKIVLFILISFTVTNSFAQNVFEFLRTDMNPRSAALGGSFISNHDDPNVIFYNPAGLKLLSNSPASFSFTKHLLDINLASVSFSKEFDNIGRFGAGIKYINYGSFTETDENGNKGSDFNASELAFIIGYANSLDENFYYGTNVKFIYSGIAGYSSTAAAFDVGLHYNIPSQELNIGISLNNIGSQLSTYLNTKEDLPFDMGFGISKKLEHLPLRLSLDFHKLNMERDNFGQRFKAFSVGAEFSLSKVLSLRLGYENEKRNDLKIGTFAGLAGFNIGLGAKINEYNFDYAYSSMGQIGSLHRIGVSTTF